MGCLKVNKRKKNGYKFLMVIFWLKKERTKLKNIKIQQRQPYIVKDTN